MVKVQHLRLIIHAPNINSGGGKMLLENLLKHADQTVILLVDARFDGLEKLNKNIDIIRVKPNLYSRLAAEFHLMHLCKRDDIVLCFGNLPPLLPVPGHVTVYVQNRYLVDVKARCSNFTRQGLKIFIEKIWLKYFLRKSTVFVQTETMKLLTEKSLKTQVRIMPFFPSDFVIKKQKAEKKFDYLYVATGERHKNHRRLIKAWLLLADNNIYPSLRLTLCKKRDKALLRWIEQQVRVSQLNIVNEPVLHDRVSDLYAGSRALIYPSLFESFGLPLLEAKANNLPIIASERDYVRDVIIPDYTFDPTSERSIFRAVLRYEGIEEKRQRVNSVNYILQTLLGD